jgi:hypothetical protein
MNHYAVASASVGRKQPDWQMIVFHGSCLASTKESNFIDTAK